MTDQTDSQLLKAYVERRLETAFTELARRHVDFVYSAAIRMVRDPHLAEDVTQGVFVALARQALELAERATLAGWLHRTAQNIAAQTVRTIERRHAREQEAVAMNELISCAPEASWEQIEPHLDAALGDLADPDRDAVLLRYYEKKTAAEMADLLGITDEAAQKRVSRAVERLREFFAKRGVTVGAGGLAIVISANAVQAAPMGLALTISTAAALTGTTLATTATVTATKAIAMTALQKTIITATVAVLAGAGIYEARQGSQLREQVRMLQQQQAPMTEQITQLQNDNDALSNHLAAIASSQKPADAQLTELLRLRGEVASLRRQVSELEKIRERNAGTQSSAIPQRALDETARMNDAMTLCRSMQQYILEHKQQPDNLDQLSGFIRTPLSGKSQFEVVREITLASLPNPEMIIVLREKEARLVSNGKLWIRIYGFADGSVKQITSKDGDFTAWEKTRIVSPPN